MFGAPIALRVRDRGVVVASSVTREIDFLKVLTGTVKRAAGLIALAFAAAMAPSGCAQILGADQSFSLDVEVAGDAGGAVDGAHDFETSTVAPCPPGQKTCAGACVAVNDPEYGCDPTSCLPPCSLPHVPVATCVDSTSAPFGIVRARLGRLQQPRRRRLRSRHYEHRDVQQLQSRVSAYGALRATAHRMHEGLRLTHGMRRRTLRRHDDEYE